MAGRAAGAAQVQALLAEQVAVLQAGAFEDPVRAVDHAIRGAGHRAGVREDARRAGSPPTRAACAKRLSCAARARDSQAR